MFKSAYIKLTLFYVLIIMIISVSFSFVLYNVSSSEINKGLRRQTNIFSQFPEKLPPPFSMEELEKIRSESSSFSTQRLIINLININLIVLILSSVLSYFLAKKTLGPIEKSLESQKRFSADASHELRTPLTAMKTEIEVGLRDKNLAINDAKSLLKSNLQEIEKLQTLSSALLKLANNDDEIKKGFKPTDIVEIIDRAHENVFRLANKKSIQFKLPTKNISVFGDADTLTEAITIIFNNAIKFSPRGSTIRTEVIKHDHHAKIIITDQGIGIHPDDLPYIFDRFYKADKSRTKFNSDGYGLGLAIAKNIIDLHGGKISTQSTLKKGTTFTIELPSK